MKGHAVMEFALVFPFFFLMMIGAWDLVCLSLARLSLQKACWAAAKDFSTDGSLPPASAGRIEFSFEPLPSPPPHLFRPVRKIELVHLQWTKDVPLRFPLLRFVFQKTSVPLTVTSTAVRMTHD